MMEHIVLEIAAFKESRREHKGVEYKQHEDSKEESDYKSTTTEEELIEMKQSSLEKEICNEENNWKENDKIDDIDDKNFNNAEELFKNTKELTIKFEALNSSIKDTTMTYFYE